MPKPDKPSQQYHHGNLRDHLIRTARSLISINGADHFKVADACKHAKVSTAAPYRHFADRKALLNAVAVQGFHDLRDETRSAGQKHALGTVSAVSAIGKAYVAFACREPSLFKLMFGNTTSSSTQEPSNNASRIGHDKSKKIDTKNEKPEPNSCEVAGRECYGVLLEQIAATLKQQSITEDVVRAAFPLWTFVHGLSFLAIDDHLSVNRMPIDINTQIEEAAMRLMPEPACSK